MVHSIVAVNAHPDDELSCLGTLAKCRERGDQVTLVAFRAPRRAAGSTSRSLTEEVAAIRQREASRVAEALGATYVCLGADDGFIRISPTSEPCWSSSSARSRWTSFSPRRRPTTASTTSPPARSPPRLPCWRRWLRSGVTSRPWTGRPRSSTRTRSPGSTSSQVGLRGHHQAVREEMRAAPNARVADDEPAQVRRVGSRDTRGNRWTVSRSAGRCRLRVKASRPVLRNPLIRPGPLLP